MRVAIGSVLVTFGGILDYLENVFGARSLEYAFAWSHGSLRQLEDGGGSQRDANLKWELAGPCLWHESLAAIAVRLPECEKGVVLVVKK